MRALVFGRRGQLAQSLQRWQGVTALGRDQADLTDPDACARLIAQTDADIVINAAAYTAVDQAETETEQAYRVNAEAPEAMARAAAARSLPFLHVSTDYVFNGTGQTPWKPDAPTGPLGVYGASKLAGEAGVRAAGGAHVILRTSWVVSAYGGNFVKTMLRLGAERDHLRIVSDQIGGPTPAHDIAAALMQIAPQLRSQPDTSGTYHFSGARDVSWADFAREIFVQAGLSCQVEDIPSADYPTPAARPANSRLDCTSLETVFGIKRPDWRVGLRDILTDLTRDA